MTSGTETTRLGVSAFPRPKYAAFVAKSETAETGRPDEYTGMILNVGRLMNR